jgi:tetratricopeptide (TPR) repeat protein
MGDFTSSSARVDPARTLCPPRADATVEAQILLGLGRSRHRFSQDAEACDLLASAASAADALGDPGYETYVISCLLLGWVLPGLGRPREAREVLDQVVERCRTHNDRLHLAAALNNRAPGRGFAGDTDGMVQDLRAVVELAREVGQPTMELMAEYNLGEQLLLLGQLADATAHVERAVLLERRLAGPWGRPKAPVLEARLRIAEGRLEKARELVEAIRAQQAEVNTRGRSDGIMVPSDDVLCAVVELATRSGSEDEWGAVDARSRRYSVEQDRLEILMIRADAALRAGERDGARRWLLAALAAAETIPNVMAARLRSKLAALEPARLQSPA